MNNKYKKLIYIVLLEGSTQDCRNGKQKIIPNYSFTLDFRYVAPKLTLRKMWYDGVVGEFNTLTSKEPLVNVSQFEANGCNYWKDWAGEDGSLNLDYANMLKPQLSALIEGIKKDPNSRRHVIELWNYKNIPNLSLPCCWHGLTFSIIDNVLHLKWVQRSVDVMIGLPADVYLAFLFMQLVAKECNLVVGSCMFALSNVHIYEEHIDNALVLLSRSYASSLKPLHFALKA